LRDFDLYFCKLFDGARHGNDDPFSGGACWRITSEPRRPNQDAIFSDGLTVPRIDCTNSSAALQLAFGIGTNLTNDL
jgi:nicotinic acid phosphoribosyltransferase